MPVEDLHPDEVLPGLVEGQEHHPRRRDPVLDPDQAPGIQPEQPVDAEGGAGHRERHGHDAAGTEVHPQQAVRPVGEIQRTPVPRQRQALKAPEQRIPLHQHLGGPAQAAGPVHRGIAAVRDEDRAIGSNGQVAQEVAPRHRRQADPPPQLPGPEVKGEQPSPAAVRHRIALLLGHRARRHPEEPAARIHRHAEDRVEAILSRGQERPHRPAPLDGHDPALPDARDQPPRSRAVPGHPLRVQHRVGEGGQDTTAEQRAGGLAHPLRQRPVARFRQKERGHGVQVAPPGTLPHQGIERGERQGPTTGTRRQVGEPQPVGPLLGPGRHRAREVTHRRGGVAVPEGEGGGAHVDPRRLRRIGDLGGGRSREDRGQREQDKTHGNSPSQGRAAAGPARRIDQHAGSRVPEPSASCSDRVSRSLPAASPVSSRPCPPETEPRIRGDGWP